MVHAHELPKVGDEVTGVVTGLVGAQTTLDDDGNEVTRARFEVELQEPLELVDVLPQEPAGGVEPHAGEPEPKITSNDNPNRAEDMKRELAESRARAQAKVDEAKGQADQNAKNKADATKDPGKANADAQAKAAKK